MKAIFRMGRAALMALMTSVALLAGSDAFAQSAVKGKVIDANGEPVIGAAVVAQGTTNGVVTDVDGNFEIRVSPGTKLEVSCIGYAAVVVEAANGVQIVLNEDTTFLDEVVVVGYGVQKKSDVTGAVASVGAKELKAMPVKNALEGMQGKVAGVDITSSQRPGEVGGISIRGVRSLNASNSPLYVVDGMVIQNAGGISNINPSDIESIDILKDASATAIYGSRGANGVVLVTTKQGKEGKVSVNYSGSVTLENLYTVGEMMSAAEWLDYARLAKYSNPVIGADGKVVADQNSDYALWGSVAASWKNIEKAYAGGSYDASKVGSYDWASEALQTGITNDHTVSVSGGTDKFHGYASFGYLNSKGTQKGQMYTRYTAKVSFDAKPLPYFQMGGTILGSFGNQDYGYSFTKSTTGAGDYYSALKSMLPWTVPFDENGEYLRNPNGDTNIINPINEIDYTTNNRKTFNVNGSFFAALDFGEMWAPLEGLSYRIQFGPEFRFYETGTFNRLGSVNADNGNIADWKNSKNRSWTLDNLVYYNRMFGQHNVNLTLMQSASRYHADNINARNTNVSLPTELWYNIGSPAASGSFGSGLTETQMTSYMVRLNYGFADKYLLTASVRWDGSSVLAEGHKWATFPSVSLGWRIDKEDFMSNANAVNMLKLRAGVGVTGNSAIGAYSTLGSIQSLYYHWGNEAALGYVKSDASAKTPLTMANQDLGWEKTTQWNFGVDYGFLQNRINGSIDVYTTKTNDLLMAMKIPSLTGYTSTMANVGKTAGWGIDFQLNASPISTRDFNWNINATWSLDRNKIVELANGATEDINNRWFVGEEIGVYYDYVYDGVWKTSEKSQAESFNRKVGQIKIKDVKEDGKYTADDRQIVGHSRPRWTAGLTNSFSYKGFDLSLFIISRWGFTIPNGALTLDGRYMQRKIDYFVPGYNEDAEYYQPGINGESADAYQSAQNYRDGSFIKVRNISLGYTFNARQLGASKINSLKLYVQAMNPFNIYRACKYLDTDLVSYDNNTVSTGSTVSTRSFVFGVNIGF